MELIIVYAGIRFRRGKPALNVTPTDGENGGLTWRPRKRPHLRGGLYLCRLPQGWDAELPRGMGWPSAFMARLRLKAVLYKYGPYDDVASESNMIVWEYLARNSDVDEVGHRVCREQHELLTWAQAEVGRLSDKEGALLVLEVRESWRRGAAARSVFATGKN